MENKKQLIIIPPMSEALKKLNEVLEGISGDENVEISIIDDLKELSQFVASCGQCLILVSNAKKCATFLQENKFVLLKHHCKTILFTPKEIPAKTLVKFTKIGLTESILENSPPKTFLYKVKLQLRSIKTIKPQEDAEQLIKSLDNSKTQNPDYSDNEIKEKQSTVENITNLDINNKKRNDESEETIDYGNPLKGKISPQEEQIDTNWKSNRNKHANIENTDEENMKAESELTSIDMYYRGKNKKIDSMLEFDEDDLNLKNVELIDQNTSSEKKSSFVDVINEGSMKQKRIDLPTEDVASDKNKSRVEQEILIDPRKNKKLLDEPESDLELNMTRRRHQDAKEKDLKTKDKEIQDTDGYLKGKLSGNTDFEEDEIKNDSEYDNSELQKDKKKSSVELDLLAGNNNKRRPDIESAPSNNTHEGQVDKIDGNMIGDPGTVEKIRTRMNGSSQSNKNTSLDEDDALDLLNKKENSSEKEKDYIDTESLVLNAIKKGKEIQFSHDNDEEVELKKPLINLDSIDVPNKKDLPPSTEPKEKGPYKNQSLEIINAEKTSRKENDLNENEDLALRSHKSSGIKSKKDGNQIHDGHTDKIDTFYRGGETKNKEQNWDNLTDKKSTLELLPGQKKSGMSTVAAEDKNLDETTIDYRKLKEEFEMMSSGPHGAESSVPSTLVSNNLKNEDDSGSFKVIEIDPKSLDFSITLINSIYIKDIKPKQILTLIAYELAVNYHCFPVFYNYKLSDKKYTEIFNSFIELDASKMPSDLKSWWNEFKKDTDLFEHFQSKSMTTWRCPDIVNNNEVWEDVELPTWSEQELKDKQVELIFPYFDGLDRMGLAIVIFPQGVNPRVANGLLTTLEMARTLFLDTIQRYQVAPAKEDSSPKHKSENKNILSFFAGLFGKRKAG